MREGKLQLSVVKEVRRYWPEILITVVVLLYHFTSPVLFNYTDGVVFGTAHIDALYPHYPLFYPLLMQGLMFVTGSFCDALTGMRFLQLFTVWAAMLYTVNSFSSRKWQATIALLLFTPIIVFQLGLGTESLFISAELLFLSSLIRLFRKATKWNVIVHLCALMLMLSTRHTGIIIATIPFVFLGIRWLKERTKQNFIPLVRMGAAYGTVYIFLSLINAGATLVLSAPKVTLYGRPAMHIITETLWHIEDPQAYDALVRAWRGQAKDEFDVRLQQCITESRDIWFGPRSCLEKYVNEVYPYFSKQDRRTFVDRQLNDVYVQFLTCGDRHVYLYLLKALWNFFPGTTDAVSTYITSHESFYRDNLNNNGYWQCDFNDYFGEDRDRLTIIRLAAAVETLFTAIGMNFLLWLVIFRTGLLRNKLMGLSMAVTLLLHVVVLTFFTCFLARYTVPNSIILIFTGLLLLPDKLPFRPFLKRM